MAIDITTITPAVSMLCQSSSVCCSGITPLIARIDWGSEPGAAMMSAADEESRAPTRCRCRGTRPRRPRDSRPLDAMGHLARQQPLMIRLKLHEISDESIEKSATNATAPRPVFGTSLSRQTMR